MNSRMKLILSIILVAIASGVTYFAHAYVETFRGTPVKDLLLDRFPPVDMNFIVTYGYYVLMILPLIVFAVKDRKKLTYILFASAILIFLRTFFIVLTHIGYRPEAIHDRSWIFETLFRTKLVARNDLFFSGHVAFPMMFGLFSQIKWLKWFEIIGAFVMLIGTLLMHVHYSIDVFAGLIFGYAVYKFSESNIKPWVEQE